MPYLLSAQPARSSAGRRHQSEEENKEEKRKPDPKEPFCGLVFKVVADPHGELYLPARSIPARSRPTAGRTTPARTSRNLSARSITSMPTRKQPRGSCPRPPAGDIVAVIGLKESITGDTLCDLQHPILLESIQFAEAVVSLSIEPESSADKDKLARSLDHCCAREDPTFTWRHRPRHGTDADERHGHAAPGNQAAPHGARFPPESARRQAARQLPRDAASKPIAVEGECIKHAGGVGLFAKVHSGFRAVHTGEEPISGAVRQPAAGRAAAAVAWPRPSKASAARWNRASWAIRS